MKFLVIRFRQKVSFIAFKHQCTIVELFCRAILKSFEELKKEGYVYPENSNPEVEKQKA